MNKYQILRGAITLLFLATGAGAFLGGCAETAFPKEHLDPQHPVDAWLISSRRGSSVYERLDDLAGRITVAIADGRGSVDVRARLEAIKFRCQGTDPNFVCSYQQYTFFRGPYLTTVLVPPRHRTVHTFELSASAPPVATALTLVVCHKQAFQIYNGSDYEPDRSMGWHALSKVCNRARPRRSMFVSFEPCG